MQKFFADRGTHLAAMIAYFALLSFVPLGFLALSLLGLTGRADESSFLVTELKHALPGTRSAASSRSSAPSRTTRRPSASSAGTALLWTSLSLFSVLESALNLVYGRPNRGFLHGKALALLFMAGSMVTLFTALLAGSLGVSALRHYLPGLVSSTPVAYIVSIAGSSLGVFAFLLSIYLVLPNTDVQLRDVLPGTALATVGLEASFQVLPIYERYAGVNPALRAFGGPAILLVWLYVMANLVVFGAEINWWRAERRTRASGKRPGAQIDDASAARSAAAARARCELPAFHSLPSSATVRDSPTGTKTGS